METLMTQVSFLVLGVGSMVGVRDPKTDKVYYCPAARLERAYVDRVQQAVGNLFSGEMFVSLDELETHVKLANAWEHEIEPGCIVVRC